ncbi:MAG: T9SS type A sorting domain-containing protein [Candidatus Azobacteroides sp.]|nr:T9SS type A sorting domain-containing protein [Candidatus Azobacteroides sp.]
MNFDKFVFRKYTSIPAINKNEITVYPNPSDGLFQILAPPTGTITINDSVGNCILEKKNNETDSTIDLSGYASGIYILTIRQENQIYQSKLIKK